MLGLLDSRQPLQGQLLEPGRMTISGQQVQHRVHHDVGCLRVKELPVVAAKEDGGRVPGHRGQENLENFTYVVRAGVGNRPSGQ